MLTASLLLLGLVLLAMGLAERHVRLLPLSASLVYLAVGWAAASIGTVLAEVDPLEQAPWLLPCTEVALLVSLFATGLRIGMPSAHGAWRIAALLASGGMLASIALGTLAAVALLDLPWPAALLLAAILAPTDPVLATEVQIHDERDRDAVRLSLTAEGGLNDGTAFPVVALALGLLGVGGVGGAGGFASWGGHWLLADLLWPIAGGLLLGALLGRALGGAIRARLRHGHALGWDELIYLGIITLAWGLARAAEVSSFLAVFAAGVALFHEGQAARAAMQSEGAESGELAERLRAFGARLERLVEVTMVLFIGAAMTWVQWRWQHVAFALLGLLVVRPLGVLAVVRRHAMPRSQRRLVCWFGIRGVGSLFYLAYVLTDAIDERMARELVSVAVLSIAASIVAHGVSATPAMNWYQRRRGGGSGA